MQQRGQVRRVDELGRVVIPKEIRFLLKINAGNMLEFSCDADAGTLTLCKFEPINQFYDFAHSCLSALREYGEYGFLLCDTTQVLCTQNITAKEYVHSTVHHSLFDKLKTNNIVYNTMLFEKGTIQSQNAVLPININGDIWGCIAVLGDNIPQHIIATVRILCNIISDCATK